MLLFVLLQLFSVRVIFIVIALVRGIVIAVSVCCIVIVIVGAVVIVSDIVCCC